MYSQCPACLAIYRLRAEQLQAHGVVRCGVCGHHFRATSTLRDRVPELEPETSPAEENAAEPQAEEPLPAQPVLPLEPRNREPEPEPAVDSLPGDGPGPDLDLPQDPPLKASDPLPSLAEGEADLPLPRARAASTEKHWPWLLAVVLLGFSALLQAAWLGRAELAQMPLTSRWVRALCTHLPCHLQPERHPDRIQAVDRSVQPHPGVEGAMLISVTMVNRDNQPQPWPIIELKLSDLDEQVVAMRRFRPEEYLQDAQALAQGMQPGVLVPVVLETLDPGRQVVTYAFDFL